MQNKHALNYVFCIMHTPYISIKLVRI